MPELHRRARAGLLPALVCGLLMLGCSANQTPVYTTQFVAFGNAVDLSLVGFAKEDAVRLATQSERDMRFYEQAWTAWRPGPMIRVNELLATTEPFAAPPSLLPLLERGRELAAMSDGLVNPAAGRLAALWGFHNEPPECRPPPSRRAIRRLLDADPTLADLARDGIMLQSDNPALMLDFSAMAKGLAMDRVMAHLLGNGVRNAQINAGGDFLITGSRSGRPWRLPVARANGTGVLGVIDIGTPAALFTAGDYQRNFIDEGRVYHDIIDPRTGWPSDELKAVTVLSLDGDAAATQVAARALFVAGLEGWEALANTMGLDHVLLIDRAGTVHMTPAMRERVELFDKDLDVAISRPPADATGGS
jgi:thiamine biosynthesis lipoprotein